MHTLVHLLADRQLRRGGHLSPPTSPGICTPHGTSGRSVSFVAFPACPLSCLGTTPTTLSSPIPAKPMAPSAALPDIGHEWTPSEVFMQSWLSLLAGGRTCFSLPPSTRSTLPISPPSPATPVPSFPPSPEATQSTFDLSALSRRVIGR